MVGGGGITLHLQRGGQDIFNTPFNQAVHVIIRNVWVF